MHAQLKERLSLNGKTYLFLNEVQAIKRWEKVVNSLASDFNVDLYVTGVNSRMMFKSQYTDIVKRNQVRKINQLERVVKYTFNNVGNTFSAKSISDYLKAEHRTLDNKTVYSYMEKLEKAYLLHRCSRFDLQGKEILKTQEKFYLADTALRYSVHGRKL